jgi:alkylation response protein AidB-like acyl-CoA dehydrogenase
MEFAFSPADEAFRLEVRAFLREQLPADLARREARGFHLQRADMADWQRILYRKGWVAPHWPKAHGGPGWTPIQRHLYEVEYGLANAPEISVIGLSMVGPMIQAFGSPELKARCLEAILCGDMWFCQGFSEPQAGSDLANLKTRAVRDGDTYVISGQKTWTTAGHFADQMICLARTRADGKPQAGLSMLIVPMDSPGVTVRPIHTIDGDHTINEVFLDDVKVPLANCVGEEHSGWTQAKFLLGHERTHNAYIGLLKRYLARIPGWVEQERANGLGERAASELLRRHALLEIDVTSLEWSVLRTLAGAADDPAAAAAASGLKIRGSQYLLRASQLEQDVLGLQTVPTFSAEEQGVLAAMAPPHAPGRATQYLYWRASSIFGGADDIQRSIIWNTLFN